MNVTERVKATVTVAGFPNLGVTEPLRQVELPSFAPAPTSIETLRHIADTISGDGAFIMQGILRTAADELEAANKRIADLERRIAQSVELISKAATLIEKKEGA